MRREDLKGTWAMEKEVEWPSKRREEIAQQALDPAFAPGTGTPEPGGFLPREVLGLLQLVAREGLIGIEVVEVSPPYDVADITALLASRIVMNVLGTLVLNWKLRRIPPLRDKTYQQSEG